MSENEADKKARKDLEAIIQEAIVKKTIENAHMVAVDAIFKQTAPRPFIINTLPEIRVTKGPNPKDWQMPGGFKHRRGRR